MNLLNNYIYIYKNFQTKFILKTNYVIFIQKKKKKLNFR